MFKSNLFIFDSFIIDNVLKSGVIIIILQKQKWNKHDTFTKSCGKCLTCAKKIGLALFVIFLVLHNLNTF